MADLELLGDLEARLEPDRDVVGDVVAADRQDTAVWNGEPSWKSARSIVPAPMSATATPSSFSVSVSTASAEASEFATSSSILTPAAATHLVRFWTAVAEAVTMWVSTSSRSALIPSGSLTPSWPSTMKPRALDVEHFAVRRDRDGPGDLDGAVDVLAGDLAGGGAVTATWPREFRHSTCWPPTPTKARSIFQPDSRSACSTASGDRADVWSMLTTTPFFSPADGTVPLPMIVSRPSRLTSPMSAQTLVVPTSMPTRTASRSTVCSSPGAGSAV